jgi:hypothetical protein
MHTRRTKCGEPLFPTTRQLPSRGSPDIESNLTLSIFLKPLDDSSTPFHSSINTLIVNIVTMSIPSTTATYPPFGSPTPYAEPLWYSRNVSPHYNDSHRKLRAAVRKYVDEEIIPYAFEWESAGRVPDSACAPPASRNRV